MNAPKILVADDSRTIRTTVSRALVGAGLEVTLACDGREAVEMARRERPDLVILDIQMPVMDGYTACEEILALEHRTVKLPIIFLTKDTAGHLDTLGSQLGAYLHKPVCDQTLVATVQSLLHRKADQAHCIGSNG
jgi:CheY-like chemotaxis protein